MLVLALLTAVWVFINAVAGAPDAAESAEGFAYQRGLSGPLLPETEKLLEVKSSPVRGIAVAVTAGR